MMAQREAPREPDDHDLETIRRLLDEAGSEQELKRWISRVVGRRRGRPRGSSKLSEYDDRVLEIVELVRFRAGWSTLSEPIRFIISRGPLSWGAGRGISKAQTEKRLLEKAGAQRRPEDATEITESEFREVRDWLANPVTDEIEKKRKELFVLTYFALEDALANPEKMRRNYSGKTPERLMSSHELQRLLLELLDDTLSGKDRS
jgi:hypothetical protein